MSRPKWNMLAERDPWATAIQEAHRDWWPDYVALRTVGCSECGLAFSAVVGRLHAERTGHRVGETGRLAA